MFPKPYSLGMSGTVVRPNYKSTTDILLNIEDKIKDTGSQGEA